MLTVDNLTVQVGDKTLLSGVSFLLEEGQVLCIVGESGAGKSILLKCLQGLMPATCDKFHFAPGGGETLTSLPVTLGLPSSRWVMQDPMAALNPRRSLGAAIGESLHRSGLAPSEVREAVIAALDEVELGPEFYDRRPGQVSLGQAQRACLARALVARPKLIVFDEPLSALDALVQKKIAYRMDLLSRQLGVTYLIVTHDIGFAEAYADTVLVLQKGRMVDCRPKDAFFAAPAKPYAASLVAAARSLGTLASAEESSAAGAEERL